MWQSLCICVLGLSSVLVVWWSSRAGSPMRQAFCNCMGCKRMRTCTGLDGQRVVLAVPGDSASGQRLMLACAHAGAKRRNTAPPNELDSLVQALFNPPQTPLPHAPHCAQSLALVQQPRAQRIEHMVLSFLAKTQTQAARRRLMQAGALGNFGFGGYTRLAQRLRLRACLAFWTRRKCCLCQARA